MLQQDLLDTLFLNAKALDAVGRTTTTSTGTSTTTTTTNNERTANNMKDATAGANSGMGAEQCPVDHKSREAWLAQARATQEATTSQTTVANGLKTQQQQQQQQSPSSGGWGWRIPYFSSSSSSSSTTLPPPPPSQTTQPQQHNPLLGTDRVISSIPRSMTTDGSSSPPDTACPVNHETETGSDAKTGNWVYPSEKMFFDAMKRKGHETRERDMKTVVPIHNAVNERAWYEIREWERPYEGESCPGGPRLYSFTGLSTKMSPRARLNTLMGYTAPFDRHDWVIDRCGTRVEYVIDFYAGKAATNPNSKQGGGGVPSFYLDVRPKLNSWEGVRMRAARALGMA